MKFSSKYLFKRNEISWQNKSYQIKLHSLLIFPGTFRNWCESTALVVLTIAHICQEQHQKLEIDKKNKSKTWVQILVKVSCLNYLPFVDVVPIKNRDAEWSQIFSETIFICCNQTRHPSWTCFHLQVQSKRQIWGLLSWMGSWLLWLPRGCPFFLLLLLYGGRLKSFRPKLSMRKHFPKPRLFSKLKTFKCHGNLQGVKGCEGVNSGTVWLYCCETWWTLEWLSWGVNRGWSKQVSHTTLMVFLWP